jgi:threonylcarbamoyladenosine tRNA methylthiotransferase MtaB
MMQDKGFTVVKDSDIADVYVVNTCSVTDHADKKCRNIVRRSLRKNPDARIVVVGCYAQLKPHEIASIKGVDMVLGAKEKFQLPELLNAVVKNPCGKVYTSEISEANFFVDAYSVDDRTRAFLKIQDGCDYKCTFCTIPLARGKSRSDTPSNVLKNVNLLAQNGVKEIVLTGVNIGDYGANMSFEEDFFALIHSIEAVDGIERIRISSIEPNLLHEKIIDYVSKSNKFVPHFHIPLQSGSDKLLSLMRRRYKRSLYKDRVSYIKENMPYACIGVDVITGFPSETEEDFMDTYQFLEDLDISYLHVFTYSERPNTLAIEMEQAIPPHIREARTRKLRALSEIKRNNFYKNHLHTHRTVLWEGEQKNGLMYGFTDNYIKVATEFQESLINTVVEVYLEELHNDNFILVKSI